MAISPSAGSPQCGKHLGGEARPRAGAGTGTNPGPNLRPSRADHAAAWPGNCKLSS